MNIDCLVKKRVGRLTQVGQNLEWAPRDASEKLVMPLSGVQGMQATPPTAAKLRIKLSPKEGAPWMLEFVSASDLESARNELQNAIKKYRDAAESGLNASSNNPVAPPATAGAPPTAPPTPHAGAPHAGAPHAGAPKTGAPKTGAPKTGAPSTPSLHSSAPKKLKKLSLDPAKLVHNLDLQRAVLRHDPELMRTFELTVIKSRALSNEQFWAPRTHLLVTAAQQQIQTPGNYNVLSTIKPTTSSDNRVNINLTREKIADLFDQYPLVRRAYNENVPKLSEGEFWQRFFMSRLFMVLRGEKVSATHPTDAVLDPYIAVLHDLQEKQRQRQQTEDSEHPAPLFVNIETNSTNNPETYGNNILTTAGGSTRSLIRSMNGLSQKLLRGKRKLRELEPSFDQTANQSVNAMRDELQLHDLEPRTKSNDGVELKISQFVAPNAQSTAQSALVDQQTPNLRLCLDTLLTQMPKSINLADLVGFRAQTGIETAFELVQKLTPQPSSLKPDELPNLSPEIALVHATTTEFLKQFWYAHAHGQQNELQQLQPYLENSLERIKAVNGLPMLQSVADSVTAALQM